MEAVGADCRSGSQTILESVRFIWYLNILGIARSPSLAWLERPADNREVLSSNLKGTTHFPFLSLERELFVSDPVLRIHPVLQIC